jgi:ribosomal protein L40E
MPPMMWVILALGLAYLVVRVFASRSEERRRAAREERMAQLWAEREAGPHSLGAVSSDAGEAPPSEAAPREAIKIRCRACKALNDESATRCAKCDAEL